MYMAKDKGQELPSVPSLLASTHLCHICGATDLYGVLNHHSGASILSTFLRFYLRHSSTQLGLATNLTKLSRLCSLATSLDAAALQWRGKVFTKLRDKTESGSENSSDFISQTRAKINIPRAQRFPSPRIRLYRLTPP